MVERRVSHHSERIDIAVGISLDMCGFAPRRAPMHVRVQIGRLPFLPGRYHARATVNFSSCP